MMNNELQEELDLFKDMVLRFIESEVAPHYEEWENNKIIPKSLYQKMGENGLLCCDIPEGYGGFYADARVQRIYGGTSEIMKEIIGRGVIGHV